MIQSYKVANNLFLVRQVIPRAAAAEAKPVETSVNHILVVDVSGSMWGEIDKIREQVKTKLPKMMRDGDTLSLIAFSGKGQFWRILTAEPVATLTDLSDVNAAIDRWLRPVGMTGFKEPIEEVGKLVAEVAKKNKNPFSLFFLSDGCDNTWPRSEVIQAIEKTSGTLAAATVVSYGFYTDMPLLTQMAEKWGGSLIVSENFAKFSPVLDAAIQRKIVGGKKVEVNLDGDTLGGFAFALDDKDLVTFGVEGDKVLIPENTREVMYLSPSAVGDLEVLISNPMLSAIYAATSLFAVRMKPDVVLPLLKTTGDVYFIEKFSTLFGRQKYSDFQEESKTAAFDLSKRLTKGYDPNKVPRDDAYTVLDFLKLLQSDDSNRVLLGHPAFKYNAIGRGRVDSSTILTDAEQAEIEKLTAEMNANAKDVKKVKEIFAKIEAITDKKGDALKFVETNAKDGYPISNLVYNEDRPNISIQIRKEGTVDLSSRLPAEFKGNTLGKVPEQFPSFVFRNYTIIKDGLVNVEKLPVRINEAPETTPSRRKALSRGPTRPRLSST